MAASVPFLHKLVQDVIKAFNALARRCHLKRPSDTLPSSSPTGPYCPYASPSEPRHPRTPDPYSLTTAETGSGSDDIGTATEGGSGLTPTTCGTKHTSSRRDAPTRNSYLQVPVNVEEAKRSGILKTSEVIVQSDPQDSQTDVVPLGLGIIASGKPCGLTDSRGTYKGSVVSTPVVLLGGKEKQKETEDRGLECGGGSDGKCN